MVSLFGFLLLAAYALRRVLGRWGVWVLAPLGGSSGALAKEAREVG